MRIGFFYHQSDRDEVALAEAIVAALRPSFASYGDAADVSALPPMPLVQAFGQVLSAARDRGLAFVIMSYGAAWALNPALLHALLTTHDVASAAVSVRAGKIVAKAAVFSPKLAYVDPDFIIVNVQRCGEIGVPERIAGTRFASHFADAGGVHAELLAVLEMIVPYGALYVYDDGSDLQNFYGERRGFAVSPYHSSRRFGFVSVTPARDPRVHAVRAALLQRYHLDEAEPLRAYIAAYARSARVIRDRDGFPFLAKPLLVRATSGIVRSAKRALGTVNYEIQKRYEDKT